MDLITVALPLSLAFIMFSLGVGLTVADFTRVATQPRAFLIGAVGQIVLLPLVAVLVCLSFGLGGALAVGFMILSFCPGGVTSNVISRLANGDVALSVSLTAVISLLSMLTVPLLLAWSIGFFEGAAGPEVNIAGTALSMALITAVPVLIGMAFRRFAGGAADASEGAIRMIANALFVLIVVAALATNWALFVENLATLGPALAVLCVVMIGLGLGISHVLGLGRTQGKTIAVEIGIQNATLGITVAGLIAATAGFGPHSLPSAVYGILMYIVALPFVVWFRSWD